MVPKAVPGIDTGMQRTGHVWGDSAQLHQPLAAFILTGDPDDRTVVFEQAILDSRP